MMKKTHWTDEERQLLIDTIVELQRQFGDNRKVTTKDIIQTGRFSDPERSSSSITNELLRFINARYGCWRVKDSKQRVKNVNKRRIMLDKAGVDLGGTIELTDSQIIPVPPKGTRVTNYRNETIPDTSSNTGVFFQLKREENPFHVAPKVTIWNRLIAWLRTIFGIRKLA